MNTDPINRGRAPIETVSFAPFVRPILPSSHAAMHADTANMMLPVDVDDSYKCVVYLNVQLEHDAGEVFSVHSHMKSGKVFMGYFDLQYETFQILQSMVSEWLLDWDCPIECKSSQHWKSRPAGLMSEGDPKLLVRNKACLGMNEMCYHCLYRAADAMRSAPVPGDQNKGWSTLGTKPPTAGTVPLPPATTTGTTELPVTWSKDTPAAEIASLQPGQTRFLNGVTDVWDGMNWTRATPGASY